jgi:hypothetical protein
MRRMRRMRMMSRGVGPAAGGRGKADTAARDAPVSRRPESNVKSTGNRGRIDTFQWRYRAIAQSTIDNWQSTMGNRQWAMGDRQWAIGNGQSATGNGQWAMGNRQSTTRQSTIDNRQSTIDNRQSKRTRPPRGKARAQNFLPRSEGVAQSRPRIAERILFSRSRLRVTARLDWPLWERLRRRRSYLHREFAHL